jgi:16S rRNA (adenine1518-N6/adenine1519-N6)-dimethyltransferase
MLADTLKILKKNGIRLNKRKGQNYLIDTQILSKILNHANISLKDTILEIGPGIGTLTIPLAGMAGKVVAVEQDQKVAEILKERLKNLKITNVEVIIGDAVKIKLPSFNKVISNLPYQISSPITFKLLKENFDYAILMYQQEFAERMIAKPGDTNYSRLSVMLYVCSDVELLFKVSMNSFFPQPKVSSAVIKLTPNPKLDIDEFFLNITRALFQHKNKKVRNALIDSFHEISNMDKNIVKDIVSNLDERLMNDRVIKLTPEEIMVISNQLKYLMNKMNN